VTLLTHNSLSRSELASLPGPRPEYKQTLTASSFLNALTIIQRIEDASTRRRVLRLGGTKGCEGHVYLEESLITRSPDALETAFRAAWPTWVFVPPQ